jgi:hypothetical protein
MKGRATFARAEQSAEIADIFWNLTVNEHTTHNRGQHLPRNHLPTKKAVSLPAAGLFCRIDRPASDRAITVSSYCTGFSRECKASLRENRWTWRAEHLRSPL